MATGRELISRVRSMNKMVNSDNLITDRAIYHELKSKSFLLIKRETNLRRLWQSPNLFTTITCLKLEPIPLSECCDFKSDCMISRSTLKIPQVSEGIFGVLVQYVFSPGKKEYKYATPMRFANIMKLSLRQNKDFY